MQYFFVIICRFLLILNVGKRGKNMKDLAIITFAVGMLAGAYVVSTSRKAQNMVESSKKAIKKKIDKMTK